MTHPPKLDDLLRDPSRYYTDPNAVIDDGRLSPAQKLEVLKAWPFAAEELDEHGRDAAKGALQQIRAALLRLHTGSELSASAPTALWRHTPRPVHDVMRRAPDVVRRDASLRSAARRMAASGQRILIADGDRLIGSLSLAAALRATLQSGCSDSTEVGTVDAAPIVYCRENDTLADALRRMAHEDSAHLAVLDAQGRLTGDLSLCDLTLETSAIAPGMREVLRRMT